MTSIPGRTDNTAWRLVKAQVKREEDYCAICRQPLDHALPPRLPRSTEIDHIIPLARGGEPYARENLRAVHRACHGKRKAVELTRTAAMPTRTAYVSPRRPHQPPTVEQGERCRDPSHRPSAGGIPTYSCPHSKAWFG